MKIVKKLYGFIFRFYLSPLSLLCTGNIGGALDVIIPLRFFQIWGYCLKSGCAMFLWYYLPIFDGLEIRELAKWKANISCSMLENEYWWAGPDISYFLKGRGKKNQIMLNLIWNHVSLMHDIELANLSTRLLNSKHWQPDLRRSQSRKDMIFIVEGGRLAQSGVLKVWLTWSA